MGKHNAESGRGRREPYNQPIKIYGAGDAAPRPWSAMHPVRRTARVPRENLTIDERVGRDIRRTRERVGLSVEQAARRLKMSPERVKRIEAGKGRLTVRLLIRIAAALGARLSILVVRA